MIEVIRDSLCFEGGEVSRELAESAPARYRRMVAGTVGFPRTRSTRMSKASTRGVVLVGHGSIPKDYPPEPLTALKTLEAKRHASGGEPSPEEIALDRRIRHWPRTPENDPYQAGLESLAAQLKAALNGDLF